MFPLGEMGMGCAMEEMELAVADMTLGSLHTVEGDATSAMMLKGWGLLLGTVLLGKWCLGKAGKAAAAGLLPALEGSSCNVVMIIARSWD